MTEKLQECLTKGKEVLESYLSIERDVKQYKENLNRRYQLNIRYRAENRAENSFEVSMNPFLKEK